MADDLISAYTADFEPDAYQDTYRERLLAIVEQKRQGKTTKPPEPADERRRAPDLLAALTASLDVARKDREKSKKPARKSPGAKSRPKASAGSSRRKTA